MPSTLGSLAGGIWGVVDRERAIAREDDQKRSDLEGRALQHLATSDDPEIAAHAWAGLMNLSQPRTKSKGLRGFFGETQANPELARIQALLQTPVARQVTEPGDPTAQATPLKVGGAAVPAAGGIRPGLVPPPAAETEPSAPPQPGFEASQVSAPQFEMGPPPAPTSRTVLEPRRAFLLPEEREIQGAIRGYESAGVPHDQAVEYAKDERLRRGGLYGRTAGAKGFQKTNFEDPSGAQYSGYFDPASGGYFTDTGDRIEGARPLTHTASTSYGGDRESLARETYGKPYAALDQTEAADVNSRYLTLQQQVADQRKTGTAQAAARAPLSSDQAVQLTNDLHKQYFQASVVNRTLHEMNTVMQTAKTALARGDQKAAGEAVIYAYEKMMDSRSTVRDSDYQRPYFNQTIWDRMEGMKERLLGAGGAGLSQDTLDEYLRMADDLVAASDKATLGEKQRVSSYAKDYGLNPLHIMSADDAAALTAPPGPGGGGGASTVPGAPAGAINLGGPPAGRAVPPAAAAPPPAAAAPPTTTAPAAVAPGSKGPAAKAEIESYARTKGLTYAQARVKLQTLGYQVPD